MDSLNFTIFFFFFFSILGGEGGGGGERGTVTVVLAKWTSLCRY